MVATKPITQSPSRSRVAGARPGPRQRDQRKNELLDAAATLFVEKGVGSTSIDDIVERTGVAKGTFYHYFQDRAAMLEALRKRYSQHFADAAQAAMEEYRRDDWQGQLDTWISTVVRQYVATYALHDAIFHDPVVCQRCVMSEEPIVQSLVELLDSGMRAGAWDMEDPVTTAVFIFHGLHGMVDETIATCGDTTMVGPRLSRLFAKMLRPD